MEGGLRVMEKKTEIGCIWEHRGEDTILWAVDYPGAFVDLCRVIVFRMFDCH